MWRKTSWGLGVISGLIFLLVWFVRQTKTPLQLPVWWQNPTPTPTPTPPPKSVRQKILADKRLVLFVGEQTFVLTGPQIVSFLGEHSFWNQKAIREYVASLADIFDQPAVNARFEFKDGRVVAFSPHRFGRRLLVSQGSQSLTYCLWQLWQAGGQTVSCNLPTEVIEPKVKTADTNRLGIVALLGEGESYFRGSPPARVANIELAAKQLHGQLVAPGERFSFAERIGEISVKTGYRTAWVIKRGKTVLEAGGGVCQVSTTLFRAVLQAGLPILERHPHAYRVGYYEQKSKPGFDATVFGPWVDFVFQNDTPAYILLQAKVDTKVARLSFFLYGTPDGRQVEIKNWRIWEVVPPPEPEYIDDPNLPIGSVKQIEPAAWGAKVAFDWLVYRDKAILHQKTFFSAYQPWRAVYLRGTKPLNGGGP